MIQSNQREICNIDFTRNDNFKRHMKQKHSTKEMLRHYHIPMNTSANDGMCQLDSSSQAEDFVDGDNI